MTIVKNDISVIVLEVIALIVFVLWMTHGWAWS